MTHEEMEQRLNAAGFFLRDDTDIRTGVEAFKGIEEAYSLHTVNPFQRHHVFGGPRTWAIEQAHKLVFVTYTPQSCNSDGHQLHEPTRSTHRQPRHW